MHWIPFLCCPEVLYDQSPFYILLKASIIYWCFVGALGFSGGICGHNIKIQEDKIFF